MNTFSSQRLILFSYLMAIEEDLRLQCVSALAEHANPLTSDEEDQARRRYKLEHGYLAASISWNELFVYLDLSQKLDVIDRVDGAIAGKIGVPVTELRRTAKLIRGLVPTRNRVCHVRPLEPDDLMTVLMVVDHVAGLHRLPYFGHTTELKNRLPANGSVVPSQTIPAFWREEISEIENNLPTPDFDDTGFVGRRSDRRNLAALLTGSHPVITVTGEGGVGKSSLVLQCLYDLLPQTSL